jgi:hypothetical protein
VTEPGDWCAVTVSVYAAMLRERVHFAEAAYRDGEWYCMLGFKGQNINGESYDPRLGRALMATLTSPVGQWCVFWWPHKTKGAKAHRAAVEWLRAHRLAVSWLPDRPIGRANEIGKARPFFQACATRRVVVVGPRHLGALTLFPVAEHIVVPPSDAWKHVARLSAEVLDVLEDDDLVLFAAGMATNLMIHRLWPLVRGRMTLLDMGAILDPYAGVLSRGVFRAPDWQADVMPRNLP